MNNWFRKALLASILLLTPGVVLWAQCTCTSCLGAKCSGKCCTSSDCDCLCGPCAQ